MKKLLVILSAISMLSVPVALAGHHEGDKGDHKGKGHHHGKMFKKMDSDNNGEVTEDEMVDSAKKRFDKMDANNDGKITKEEAHEMRGKMKEKMKEHKKKHKDGYGDADSEY